MPRPSVKSRVRLSTLGCGRRSFAGRRLIVRPASPIVARKTCNTHRVRGVGASSTNLTFVDAFKVRPTLPAETSSVIGLCPVDGRAEAGTTASSTATPSAKEGFDEVSCSEMQEELSLLGRIAVFEEEAEEEDESMGVDPPCWGARRLTIGANSVLGLLPTPVPRESS